MNEYDFYSTIYLVSFHNQREDNFPQHLSRNFLFASLFLRECSGNLKGPGMPNLQRQYINLWLIFNDRDIRVFISKIFYKLMFQSTNRRSLDIMSTVPLRKLRKKDLMEDEYYAHEPFFGFAVWNSVFFILPDQTLYFFFFFRSWLNPSNINIILRPGVGC